MVDSVYNYMVTNYTPKSITRYDTHKPGELRNIYKKIMVKSAKSPIYKIKFSDNMQKQVISMKDSALALSGSIALLNPDDPDSVFHFKQADSSDPSCASVVLAEGDNPGDAGSLSVKVDSIATKQVNRSRAISDAEITPSAGDYSFCAELNGISKTFPVCVESHMKNSEILSQISSSINRADIGIHSFIESNNSYMTLTIESDFTGHGISETTFHLSDQQKPEFQKGILSYYNLLNPDEYPQNAVYEINGVAHEATSNELVIDSYKISLHKPTEEPLTIGLKINSDKLIEGLLSMKDSYNQLVKLADSVKNPSFNKKLNNDLQTISSFFKNDLESSGILFDEDGLIKVDSALAIQSADSGDLQKLFSGSSGFVTKLKQRINSISLDPMDYVHKILITYPNIRKAPIANPYMTSIYSGMLFNYYC